MDIQAETIINGTSSRITTSARITEVTRAQVPNGDDLSGTAETRAYLLVQVDTIQRWIHQFGLPSIDLDETHVLTKLEFQLNLRIMCSNVAGYLHQELEPHLLHDIIPPFFWNEFIDTLTSNFKTILPGRKLGQVEILSVDVEVVNAEPYDAQRFQMGEFFAAALSGVALDEDDDDGESVGDQSSLNATPTSQDSMDALEAMTYEQSRYITTSVVDGDHANDESSHCSICLNEYLNVSMIKWMPCSHMFHSECIEGWLKKKNTCPLCRFEMPISEP